MRSRHLPGLPVLTLDSGTTIGRINRSVVDPEKKRVAALLVAPPRLWGKRLLPIESVHAFGGHAVTVGSAEALIPVDQDERLTVLLRERRIPLLGSPVVTAGGELVGTVRDYEIDPTGAISYLYVTDGVWRALSGREHKVPGSALLALGRDAVIVTEETLMRVVKERENTNERGRELEPPDEVPALWKIPSRRARMRLTPDGAEPSRAELHGEGESKT